MLGIAACYVGSVEKGEHALRPLCEFGPPAQNQIAPMSYVVLQSAVDPLLPRGRRYYWKTHLLKEIDDGTIDVLLDSFARVPSPMSIVSLQQLGGAAARVAPEATAYAHRDAAFDCVPICAWENAAEDETNIAWAREMWEALRPFASGRVYVNNLGEEGEDRVRAAYGVNYDRLATVKAKYDPDNLFRLIKPLV